MKSQSLDIINNSTGVKAFDVLRRHISSIGQRSPKNAPRMMLVKMCRKLLREERRIVKRIQQIEYEITAFEAEAAARRQATQSEKEKN